MENTVEKLGEKITRLRGELGWSQEKLAIESGVGRRTLQKIESGETESPGIDSVIDLAQALGISVSALVDDAPTRKERTFDLLINLLSLSDHDFTTAETTISGLKILSESRNIKSSKV